MLPSVHVTGPHKSIAKMTKIFVKAQRHFLPQRPKLQLQQKVIVEVDQ